MTPDCELLRQYAEEGSEPAFSELVRRHVDWVYSAALRLVAGDAHRAQDVAQCVFADLARKAPKLWRHETLIGWLHTSTRFAALGAIRSEQRRHAREQEASIMNDTTTAEVNWEQLRPMLDEAVGHLKDADRLALLLRFFQGMNHQQIGAALGLSEDTARKRVERALEKLRAVLAHRGITTSSAFLVLALGANTVQAAPPSFAAQVASASLADAGGAIAANTFWKTLFMTTKTKSVLAASVVLAALIAWVLISSKNSGEISPAKSPAVSAPAQPPVLTANPKLTPNAVSAPVSPPVAAASSSPPTPAATSARPATATTATNAQSSRAMAVQNNLRQIINAAQFYMLYHHVSEVRYADLAADKTLINLDLNPIVPVAGENYDSLVVHKTDNSFSLAVPGLGLITFDLEKDTPPSVAQTTGEAPPLVAPKDIVDKGTIVFTDGVPITMTSPTGDVYAVVATQLPDDQLEVVYGREVTDSNGNTIVPSVNGVAADGPDKIVTLFDLGIKFKPVMK